MKMTGSFQFCSARRCCRSSPEIPGSRMSRIRQPRVPGSVKDRNCSAEENSRTGCRSDNTSRRTALRTEISSSTTKTMGEAIRMPDSSARTADHRSAHAYIGQRAARRSKHLEARLVLWELDFSPKEKTAVEVTSHRAMSQTQGNRGR